MSRYLLALSLAAVVTITAMPTARPQAPTPQATQPGARKEQHPRIRAALNALKYARAELEAAPHDFGGHRTDAVRAVDEAAKQLSLAWQYNNK